MNTSKPGWFAAIAQTRTALAKARAEYEAAGLRVLSAEARLLELEASALREEIPEAWHALDGRLHRPAPTLVTARTALTVIKGGKP